jgi:pimeloyl-ACP methyl ester carboxylesterase
MTSFTFQTWPTRRGPIASYSAISPLAQGRPVAVILHGALRASPALFPWAAQLSDLCDTMLIDLPGHGQSSSSGPASIQGMAEAVHEAISAGLAHRRVLVVGESLGGAVALAIGGIDSGPVEAVFAADPPMTTGKLWNLVGVFRSAMGKSAEPTFVDRLGRETFGITPMGIEELIYYPLIGRLRVPAVIATGDVPLLPPRSMSGIACLFDAVDRFVLENLYPGKVRIEQIPNCGHVLLVSAPGTCREIVADMLRELATRDAGTALPFADQ